MYDEDSGMDHMVCETLHYKNHLKSRTLLDLPPTFAGLKKKQVPLPGPGVKQADYFTFVILTLEQELCDSLFLTASLF